MISRDIQIMDIHPVGWLNFINLFSSKRNDGSSKPLPTLTIYHENGVVLKAIHSEKGVLRNFGFQPFEPLANLAKQQNLGMVRSIEASSIENIFSRFQRRLKMKDDFVKQCLTIYDVVRSEIGKGIKIFPSPRLPRVSYKFIQRTFDFLVKDGTCIIFYVFDDNGVHTSLILGKTDGDISLFTTHDTLMAEGLNAYSLTVDHTSIEIGINKKFNLTPTIGIYAGLERLQYYISRGRLIGGLRKMRRRQSAIISPFPLRWKILMWAASLLGK